MNIWHWLLIGIFAAYYAAALLIFALVVLPADKKSRPVTAITEATKKNLYICSLAEDWRKGKC